MALGGCDENKKVETRYGGRNLSTRFRRTDTGLVDGFANSFGPAAAPLHRIGTQSANPEH